MRTMKAAGIWLACGVVPVAIVVLGSLSDRPGLWGAVVMPLLMVALFFWFLGGLVMVATWQQHRSVAVTSPGAGGLSAAGPDGPL